MKILIIVLALNYASQTFSSDTSLVSYYPLKTGNVWAYKTTFSPIPFPPSYHKEFIQSETIINGKKYFLLNKGGETSLIRIDSSNGNLLVYSPGNGCGSYSDDKIIDSLASNSGDEITCEYQSIFFSECVSISQQSVFGTNTDTKEFYHDGLTIGYVKYAKGFGVISSCSGGPPPCSGYTNLLGCVIDGVVYGDTTLTGIQQNSSIVPENFSLSQNYPNPFNPNTVIIYKLRVTGFAKLIIYDVLGNELGTLVNEKQNAGSYSAEFDGSGLSSGVYFYKLEAGDFAETRRMVLLK